MNQVVSGSGFCKHKLGNDLIVVTLQQLSTREPMGGEEKVHGFQHAVTRDSESSYCLLLHYKLEEEMYALRNL